MTKSQQTSPKNLIIISVALGISNIMYALVGTFLNLTPEHRTVTPLPEWTPGAVYLVGFVLLVVAVVIFGRMAEQGRQALSEGDQSHQRMSMAIAVANGIIEVPGLLALVFMITGHSILPLYYTTAICTLTSFGAILPKVVAYVKEADQYPNS